MTLFNAHALGSLVTMAGNALSRRLTVIVGALVQELETTADTELRDAIAETLETLLGSIVDAEGLNTLMLLLLEWWVYVWQSVLQFTHCQPGPNTMTRDAVPVHVRCSPRSARRPSWTPHCTASIGSVSSSH